MATETQRLSTSLEDYLEAILHLVRAGRVARVRDIAKRLEVGMPSVSTALKALSSRGLVNYDPYQVITLTDRGLEVAKQICQRHNVLRRFLTDVLGVDAQAAEANACRMEHAVDEAVLKRLSRFDEFLRRCPRAGSQWVQAFLYGCSGDDRERCGRCLADQTDRLKSHAGG